MSIAISNIIPFTQARAQLSSLVDVALAGQETIITKDGRPAVALIDAQKLDHYHRLEEAAMQLMWLDEASASLQQVMDGQIKDAGKVLDGIAKRRATKPTLRKQA